MFGESLKLNIIPYFKVKQIELKYYISGVTGSNIPEVQKLFKFAYLTYRI